MHPKVQERIDRQQTLVRSALTDAELREAYVATAHAVQSATALRLARDPGSASPKHLRTGVDLTKAEFGGLARLLISKGLISQREYMAAMLEGAELENEDNQREFGVLFG